MVVIGDNLRQLISQYKIVDRPNCYDETCIQLSLGTKCIKLTPKEPGSILTYGERIPADIIEEIELGDEGLLLQPKTAILASSAEQIEMPRGYMGLLQTKGSLARLCVSLHFYDGQIDSGYKGKITFELFNASDFTIRIRKLQAVGNLYILKATTKRHSLYSGRYLDAEGPTIQLPFK